jgi:hypothetical protein
VRFSETIAYETFLHTVSETGTPNSMIILTIDPLAEHEPRSFSLSENRCLSR